MQLIEIDVDNSPDIKFYGEKLGIASSKARGAKRWTVLTIYKTRAGKYVCHKEGQSLMPDERLKSSCIVAETPAEVIDFFGQGPLSKELYKDAGILNAITID